MDIKESVLSAHSPHAIQVLLGRSLDYAGLFPPAQLPLDEALSEFTRCQRDPHAWLLARFVLPAARVAEFAQLAAPALTEAESLHQPWHLTALMRSVPSTDEALRILRGDAQMFRALVDARPSAVIIDSCELPLPEEVCLTHDQEIARGFFAEAEKIFDEFNLRIPIFWEVNLKHSFAHIALAAHQSNGLQAGRTCLKFRTGGLTASAIVSAETLAHAFYLAQREHVPFKLTAGLHSAIRHFDSKVGGELFGFLNVFAAAVLGWTHQLSESEIRILLEEKDPQAIKITADGLAWKKYLATIAQIQAVRMTGLRSFGSCSFYEPIEELRQLNLLAPYITD